MHAFSNKELILLCRAIFATLFTLLLFLGLPSLNCAKAQSTPVLTINDCPKCHSKIVDENNRNGAAHKSKITCLNCHEGHPPAKRNIIPDCHKCHTGQEHFTLPDCLACHRNPHTPLVITLPKDITYPCTTCHKEQIKQLKKYPSMHSTFACTACHPRHGYKPSCFYCHAPHLPSMVLQDCLSCHKPHMPLMVTYGPNVPSEFCGACHTDEYKQLGASHAKHRKIACVRCHEAIHKTIPKCTKCHKEPHDKSFIKKFGSCLACHVNPHDLQLNNIDMELEQR